MPAPGQPRSSVCRRLFFDDSEDDHSPAGQEDNAANTLLEMMRDDNERAKQKWNFDFETETPLEGRWQWTPMTTEQNGTNGQTPLSESSSWTTLPAGSSSSQISIINTSASTTNRPNLSPNQETETCSQSSDKVEDNS